MKKVPRTRPPISPAAAQLSVYLFTSAWDAATGEVDPESVPRARGQRGADPTRRAPLRAEPTRGQPHTQPPSSHSSGPGRSRHSGRGSLVSPQYLQIAHSQIHLLAKNSFASPRSTLSALLWPFVWTCAATCPTHTFLAADGQGDTLPSGLTSYGDDRRTVGKELAGTGLNPKASTC